MTRPAKIRLLFATAASAAIVASALAAGSACGADLPVTQQVESGQTVYELGRLEDLRDEPWRAALLIAALAAALAFAWGMIRRDTLELPAAARWFFLALRTSVLVALVVYYLQPQRRSVQQIVRPSRVVLLVDTSQSMGLADHSPGQDPAVTRVAEAQRLLLDPSFLANVQRRHDLVVYGFDRQVNLAASLLRRNSEAPPAPESNRSADPQEPPAGTADSPWIDALRAVGGETRIGEALRRVLTEQQAAPLSSVVLISDGVQNGGLSCDAAAEAAVQANVPVFAVGLGSDRVPANVAVRDISAPARAYPGDGFQLTAYVEAQGLEGRTVTVELASEESNVSVVKQTERVVLGADGTLIPVRFDISADEPARVTYRVRVEGPTEDREKRDDSLAVDVEIVNRESQALLWAGAASREYRFVRNLLWRDKGITVHVLLQTGATGVSQEADRILDHFPKTREELFAYDCLVAFDPDWSSLEPAQIELLKQWVGSEAGGLVFVAGQVHGPMLPASRSPVLDLLPVRSRGSLPLFEDSDQPPSTAAPVLLSAEGRDAQFLWLEESALESEGVWLRFPGAFAPAKLFETKPGATVYAYVGEQAPGDVQQTAYLAEHFFGAGRVFFVGSGELWRLRGLGEEYFERFYTKLIRHVSQGRLLRGSSRGMLLVERDRYEVGGNVVVRAQLADVRHQPLAAPTVSAQVTASTGDVQPLVLSADRGRPGMFVGQFTVLHEGGYRIDLPMPEAPEQQLTRHIQVRVPDREREDLRRNDALLGGLASRTGGRYYVGVDAAVGESAGSPLVAALPDRTETDTVAGRPDAGFEKTLSLTLLAVVSGLLCTEWLVRRLQKLA